MVLLFGFAFLSGLLTILAPCIWPLLPIVLSASASGKSHTRPLGVTLGIMLSFGFFTLAISYLVTLFHLDANVIRLIAVIILVLVGIAMIVPQLMGYLEVGLSRVSSMFGQKTQTQGADFQGGFIMGLALGVVWAPCAGPILASIAALAATGKVTLDVVLVTFFYVLGVGVPLFLFAYGGQKVFRQTRFLSKHLGRIQQIFGVIMLITALAIYTNYDKVVEANLLNAFPDYTQSLIGFESGSAVQNQLQALKGKSQSSQNQINANTNGLFNADYPAPDFTGITHWLNTPKPIHIQNLRGHVVLVDFWTYTCINCIRTLPFVTSWYDKYKDQGFVVIGVHTPEFQFEHDTNNVESAIKQFKIYYPVAQDNNYATWNAYNNEYWPAEYLIDAQGNVRRTDFGEGNYGQSEMAIQALLREAGKKVNGGLVNIPDQTPTAQISPETYIGSNRMEYYDPLGSLGNGDQTFTLNNTPQANSFSLGGEWNIGGEYSTAGNNAVLTYQFVADKVHLVLAPPANASNCNANTQNGICYQVQVFLDNKPVPVKDEGEDVTNGKVTINEDRLYNLIDLHGPVEDHVLKLKFTKGIQAYAFTFG